jgi:hypothetical protein
MTLSSNRMKICFIWSFFFHILTWNYSTMAETVVSESEYIVSSNLDSFLLSFFTAFFTRNILLDIQLELGCIQINLPRGRLGKIGEDWERFDKYILYALNSVGLLWISYDNPSAKDWEYFADPDKKTFQPWSGFHGIAKDRVTTTERSRSVKMATTT